MLQNKRKISVNKKNPKFFSNPGPTPKTVLRANNPPPAQNDLPKEKFKMHENKKNLSK